MVAARGWGQGENEELFFNGYRVSVYKMKRVLEMDDDDGSVLVWMYLMPPNSTFKNG